MISINKRAVILVAAFVVATLSFGFGCDSTADTGTAKVSVHFQAPIHAHAYALKKECDTLFKFKTHKEIVQ
ncbi:hypothetical protein [Lentilactobacillus kisonensis]|uniref:hypothetical protein n=1 Tax=Lentilactobacillus kisonensis TaxID=481722 RepID=UPI000A7F030F|nr:hypothetical protein [Lentilactobacillus kisonensis]